MQHNKNPKKTTNYTTMKKLLLLLAGCLLASNITLAQSQDGEEPEATTTPGWTVRLNITEPANVVSDQTYEMTKTDVQIGNEYVYSYTVTVNVDPSKSSKYYIYVSYTNEEGVVKTKNTAALYQTYNDGPVDITVAAFVDSKGEIQYILSNSKYLLCDTNWTGIGYFDASKDGLPNEIYYNNTKQKGYVAVRNLGTATTEYLPGGNTQYQSNLFIENNPGSQFGLFKAVFDYSNMTLSFEKINSLTLDVEDFIPFVSASEATLPMGLTAYVYSSYEDGVISMETLEGNVVPANTPVLLKGKKGSYTITLSDDYNYVFVYDEGTSTRNYLIDSNSEGSLLYGVHQPHLVPANGYIYNNGTFTKASASDIIIALNCYFVIDDASAPESISIVFPEEEEQDGITVNLGSDTTNQSGTIENNEITITTVGDGALIYVEVGDEVRSIYYYIAEKEVVEEDGPEDLPSGSYAGKRRVLPDGASYTEAIVNNGVVTIPLEVGEGQLHIATSADGDNEQVFTYTVAKGVPTAVEAIETAPDEDGAIYNIFGQKVDASYKGIVIKNGKKFIQR